MTKTEILIKINRLEADIKAMKTGAVPDTPWGLGYLNGKLSICKDLLAEIEQKEKEEESRMQAHYAYALANGLA